MRVKQGIAAATLAGALAFSGAGVAQAQQNAGAIAGLAAVAANVDIDTIQIVQGNDIIDDVTVDVSNNLNRLTIEILNENDIRLRDVVDVTVVGNVLVVDVL
jgi:hypothetical protein